VSSASRLAASASASWGRTNEGREAEVKCDELSPIALVGEVWALGTVDRGCRLREGDRDAPRSRNLKKCDSGVDEGSGGDMLPALGVIGLFAASEEERESALVPLGRGA
jgi:hypothetical protein